MWKERVGPRLSSDLYTSTGANIHTYTNTHTMSMTVKKHAKLLQETKSNKMDKRPKVCVCLRNSIWFGRN